MAADSPRSSGLEALGRVAAPALRATLEVLPGAALLVRLPAKVIEANAAARVLLGRDPALLDRIRGGAEGRSAEGITVARVGPGGGFFLARVALADGDLEPRVAAAASRWGLTARERDALALVARGLRNREIARRLRCAEATVERHLGSLLRKSGTEGRAALAANVWTGCNTRG